MNDMMSQMPPFVSQTIPFQGVLPDGTGQYQGFAVRQVSGRYIGMLMVNENSHHFSNEHEPMHITHKELFDVELFCRALERLSAITTKHMLPTWGGPEEMGEEQLYNGPERYSWMRADTTVVPISFATRGEPSRRRHPRPEEIAGMTILGEDEAMEFLHRWKRRQEDDDELD